MIIEGVRHVRQAMGRKIHEELHGDQIYPRIPLSIRNFTFETRWQEAERISPLDQREFVRQEIMDLIGNVDERGGQSNYRSEPISVDQLRSSSLPVELVEFIMGGVEDTELTERMTSYNIYTPAIRLRMNADFATYQRWATTNIRLVLAKVTLDGMVIPAHEFGIAVNATMPPMSETETPTADIYDAALHLDRPGTSGTAMVDMVARHKGRYDALLAYKHNTSKVTIARQLITFGQQVLQTPHEQY